jgi:hypothetical protein
MSCNYLITLLLPQRAQQPVHVVSYGPPAGPAFTLLGQAWPGRYRFIPVETVYIYTDRQLTVPFSSVVASIRLAHSP